MRTMTYYREGRRENVIKPCSGQPFLRVLQDRTNGSWVPRDLLPSTSGRLDGISQWLPDLYSAVSVQTQSNKLLTEWNRMRNWGNDNTPSYLYIQYYRIPFRLLNSLGKIMRMVIKEITSISLGVFVLWWHIYFVMSIYREVASLWPMTLSHNAKLSNYCVWQCSSTPPHHCSGGRSV